METPIAGTAQRTDMVVSLPMRDGNGFGRERSVMGGAGLLAYL